MQKLQLKIKDFFAGLIMACSVLGCVLGAGFLSGAEIYSFFVRFGYYGVVGAMLCACLFGAIVYVVSVSKIKAECSGSNANGGSAIKTNNSLLMQICGLIIAGTMVAGTNNILVGFGCSAWLSGIIVFMCLLGALALGLRFAKVVNIGVTMLALVFVLLIAFSRGVTKNVAGGIPLNVNFVNCLFAIVFAVSYACMNAISSYTMLSELNLKGSIGTLADADYKRRGRYVAIWTGLILAALILIIFVVIVSTNAGGDMPLVNIINNKIVKVLYCSLLVVAMLSTMFSCAIGGQKLFIKRWGKGYSCLIVSMLCQAISFAGFGNLVAIGYPILGAIVAANFVIKFIKNSKIKAKLQKNSVQA